MGRDRSRQSSNPISQVHSRPSEISLMRCDSEQQQLFSFETLERAGRPIRLVIQDPIRAERHRILVIASQLMRELVALLEMAAPTNGTILLQGESGSGKNLLANYVHVRSHRSQGPFVQFSAGHHSENLIESELFGHEEGAFTGAHSYRAGKFELADGGTLFIDEVGDLSPAVQLKLHRFLDDQVVERVGATRLRHTDVRVIAATHRDLWGLVKTGRFREDLYYRLSVVSLLVPSLRERPEEIPLISQMLLEELAERHQKPWLRWDRELMESLSRLPWRGNVRELRNAVERMVILARGDTLSLEDLSAEHHVAHSNRIDLPDGEHRRRFIETYEKCAGNRSAIAKALGTSRSQVRRMIDRFGLTPDRVDQL